MLRTAASPAHAPLTAPAEQPYQPKRKDQPGATPRPMPTPGKFCPVAEASSPTLSRSSGGWIK